MKENHMLISVVCGLTACGGGESEGTYDITVWVGEGTDTLTRQQIQSFNETNEWGVTFNATVEIVSESKAAGNAISTPSSAADIFCIAQDQLARVVKSNLLATLNSASVEYITSTNDADSVSAATIGSTVRAFPMTADNGFFMYYDKRYISEDSVGSLEALIADCEAAGKNFSMNLTEDGGSWYAASFFYATGCKSEWTTDESGNFTDYDDDFDSENGIIALQGMQKLLQSSCYNSSAEVSDFSAAIPSAVVISGIWGYKAAYAALGENLGVAQLPSFTVDGESYQLVSYLGRKLMCVKPQSDSYRALYLQKLAMYLTSEECQLQRFEEVGWGPSNDDYTETIAHSYQSVYVAPTCTEGGYMEYTCVNCGDTYSSEISLPSEHSYTITVVRSATCTETGLRHYCCDNCGYEYDVEIPATGHNYVITNVENNDGDTIRTYQCDDCGDSYTEDLGNQAEYVASYVEYLFELYSDYIWWLLLATVGVWSIVMGVFFAIATKNEDKQKARKMVVNYLIGLVAIAVILVAAPLLVYGIAVLVT